MKTLNCWGKSDQLVQQGENKLSLLFQIRIRVKSHDEYRFNLFLITECVDFATEYVYINKSNNQI